MPTDDTSNPAEPSLTWSRDATLRYRLTIAYDGAKFHGWQRQEPPGGEPLRTVQGVLERALKELLKQPLNLLGASRTDAGVHALGQVACFDATSRVPIERLPEAINARLHEDVEVRAADIVPMKFHPSIDATCKQYRYRIHNSSQRPLDRRNYTWHCWYDLDIDRMNAAAQRLVGTHDFIGFAAASDQRATTVRTIFDCHVERASNGTPEVHVVIVGDGFLYNMVRIITGTLVEVGRGRFEPQVIDHVLATLDRANAGPTLPPNGLWLEWIRYENQP
jgi:tRNA pseudouridine38-40 synthase